jgi:predicted kinase
MRKWMSERFKRRKKAPEKTPAEPTAAPLQPKYFDSEPASEAPAEGRDEPQPEAPSEAAPAPREAQETPARPSVPRPQSSADSEGLARGRRRRRGRGGRGRSRSSAQSGVAGAPPLIDKPLQPAEAAAPLSAAPSAPRPSKGVVVLAIGLPGSGKSSWFKRHKITPLSSDVLRALLFDDPAEQRFQDLVFSNLRSMLKARLIARRPLNYVDATNLTPHERQNWIKLGQDYGYDVQAVYFDVPVDVCLERNQRRERVVAEDVMRRMAAKLRPPTFEEGFSKITVVKVKKKDGEPEAV